MRPPRQAACKLERTVRGLQRHTMSCDRIVREARCNRVLLFCMAGDSVEAELDSGLATVVGPMAAAGIPMAARRRRTSMFASIRQAARRPLSLRMKRVQEEAQAEGSESFQERPREDYRHPTVHPINRNMWNPLNLLSYCSFSWINPVMDIGAKRTLHRSDLIDIPAQECSTLLADRLEASWERHQHSKHPIFNMYVGAFSREIAFILFLEVFDTGIQLLGPIFLGKIVGSLQGDDVQEMYLWAMAMAIATFAYTFLHHVVFFLAWKLGLLVRTATITLVYRRMLRLNCHSMSDVSSGMLLNMISNDSERFINAAVFLPYLLVAPIQVAIVLWLTWDYIGYATLCGVGLLFAMTPLHFLFSRLFRTLREKTASRTDERIKTLNEVINGIRVIKMYAWERPFFAIINRLRSFELLAIRSTLRLRSFNMGFYFVATSLTSFFSFMTYFLSGHTLTPKAVFGTISLFSAARLSATLFFPGAVQTWSELGVGFDRLYKFLTHGDAEGSASGPRSNSGQPEPAAASATPSAAQTKASPASGTTQVKLPRGSDGSIDVDEVIGLVRGPVIETTISPAAPGPDSSTDPASLLVDVRNISVAWRPERPIFTGLSLELRKGEVVAVVGPVGCGKTTLLMALLEEIAPYQGLLATRGTVTYASQEAWILSDTVRSNITFGLPFEQEWYDTVVDHCELRTDFSLFSHGDMTEIGERGVNLSGGQKARVALARAVYSRSDVILLDDPLSAVDSRVGHRLFHNCIRGLLRTRACVLVTHQLQFIRDADRVLAMGPEGRVLGYGPYEALAASEDASLLKYIKSSAHHGKHMDLDAMDDKDQVDASESSDAEDDDVVLVDKEPSQPIKPTAPAASGPASKGDSKLIQDEKSQEGLVGWASYKAYIDAAGGWVTFSIATVMCIVTQVLAIMADWFLSYWTNLPADQVDDNANLGIYGGIVGALIILAFGRTLYFMQICNRASQHLHDRAFQAILHSPMRFFDTNPVGRVMNRFSKDVAMIDDTLPWTLLDFVSLAFMVLGVFLLVAVIDPWIFILLLPVSIYFYRLRVYYAANAREIKRIESVARSPLYAHFMTCITGLPTIRAFRAQDRFLQIHNAHLDNHTVTYYAFIVSSRWLGFRLDFLSSIFLTATAFVAVAARDTLTPAQVGLSLTYALQLTAIFQWCVRQSSEVENLMTSVERVAEYTGLPVEEPENLIKYANEPPPKAPGWPDKGAIDIKDMCLAYGTEKVLRDITMSIRPGEKIGIVGRTGAGKSSVIAALYRLYGRTGEVVIDGLPTSAMPLETLRGSINVIPQDPVIFSGSVRRNLDPFGTASDAQLWQALEEVQLATVVRSLPDGLDASMSKVGMLSVGQRQLICLARAILRPTKILVLDEATAHVDSHTDHLIQGTITEKFKDITVITIAHRLNTVLHSDRIAVLDKGALLEFDSPARLQAAGGTFAAMLAQAQASHAPGSSTA
eukprot:m.248138 g.248138  ORF g.248138 m.248138 type:complete len:1461 (-) comp15641_c0_seq1:176-4558(-)